MTESIQYNFDEAPLPFNASEMANYIGTTLRGIIKDTEEFFKFMDQVEADYRDKKPEKTEPFIGCSNISIPISSTFTDAVIPRLIEGLFDHNPPFEVIPVSSNGQDYRNLILKFLLWDVKSNADLKEALWHFIGNSAIYGTGFAETYFVQEKHVVKDKKITAYLKIDQETGRVSQKPIMRIDPKTGS